MIVVVRWLETKVAANSYSLTEPPKALKKTYSLIIKNSIIHIFIRKFDVHFFLHLRFEDE